MSHQYSLGLSLRVRLGRGGDEGDVPAGTGNSEPGGYITGFATPAKLTYAGHCKVIFHVHFLSSREIQVDGQDWAFLIKHVYQNFHGEGPDMSLYKTEVTQMILMSVCWTF